MDNLSYKTVWFDGREIMPGESMRFVNNSRPNKVTRMAVPLSGGNIAPVFDRDKSGKLATPKPHRPGEPDYTIGTRLSGGDKRAYGKLLDTLNRKGSK